MRFCADAGHAGSKRLQAAAASPPHATARLLRLSGPSHRTLMAGALLLEARSRESSRTEACIATRLGTSSLTIGGCSQRTMHAQAWRSMVLFIQFNCLSGSFHPLQVFPRYCNTREATRAPRRACSRARCSARPRALTGAHESSRSGAPRVHWSSTRHFRPHA